MVSVNVEQRVSVKFCVKLGKSSAETYDLLKKVYGDDCLSRTQVFEWFKKFKVGREGIGDDQNPGQKQTLTSKKSVKLFNKIVARPFEQLLG